MQGQRHWVLFLWGQMIFRSVLQSVLLNTVKLLQELMSDVQTSQTKDGGQTGNAMRSFVVDQETVHRE